MQIHHLMLDYFTYQYSKQYNQSVIKLLPYTGQLNLTKLRNTGLPQRQVRPAPLVLTLCTQCYSTGSAASQHRRFLSSIQT